MTKEQLAAAIANAFPKSDGNSTPQIIDLSNKLADAIYQFVTEQINSSKSWKNNNYLIWHYVRLKM